MKSRLLIHSTLMIAAALAAGCGRESFPVTPTPVATAAVVVQGTRYQGTIALVGGGTTSFNMTLIARELAGVNRVAPRAAGTPAVTGNFETGNGLKGTVQGNLAGSLDSGFFDGSLTSTSSGHATEQKYTGPITTTTAALAPGDCVQGTCAADGLTGAIQTAQTPPPNGPPPATCTFTISPATAAFAGAGGTGSVAITAAANCGWSAIPTSPWIEIVGTATGTGSGAVTFRVQSNPGDARQGNLIVGGQTMIVTQGSACSYALSPGSASAPAAGGAFSASLTTSCGWAAASDVPWISITSGASGTTGGTIEYAVTSNPEPAVRVGHLTVTGPGGTAQLTVTQSGIACTYALNPAAVSAAAGGGSFSAALTTSCGWTAASDVPWITITAGASGSSSGTIAYAVQANTGAQRTGHITVTGSGGSATVTVTQGGVSCSYTLSSSAQSAPAAGGSFSTALALAASCTGTWTASSDVPWITSVAPASGTMAATIGYLVQVNTGVQRTGHITVTGPGGTATLTVTQDGITCAYSLTPNTQSVPTAGGPFSTVLALAASCTGTWTAASDVSWITNVSPVSGTAGATIAYVVQPNTGVQRTGHITVTGPGGTATLTVTQIAIACAYTLTPNTQSVPTAGGSFSTALALAASCTGTWTASSDVTWITNVAPASGTTAATIAYVVQANAGVQRTGHVTVTGPGGTATLTVTQTAVPCTYALTPNTLSVPFSGGSFSTALLLTASCTGTWTASSDVPWITNLAPASGTASVTIAFGVQSNSGGVRRGQITVTSPAGTAQLTVTQSALILTAVPASGAR